MRTIFSFAIVCALFTSVALGQQGQALLKIVVDEQGKVQVYDLHGKPLTESQDPEQQTSAGKDIIQNLTSSPAVGTTEAAAPSEEEQNNTISGTAVLQDLRNSRDPEAVQIRKRSKQSETSISAQQPNLTLDVGHSGWSYDFGTKVLSTTSRVINIGSASAGSSRLGYYLSTSNIISTADTRIGDDYVPGLNPGAYSDESFSLNLCALPLVNNGTYHIGWIVDYRNSVPESNEVDNTFQSSSSISLLCAGPNLTIDAGATSASYNSSSRKLTINTRVINTGTSTAGSAKLGYYLSTNDFISPADYLVDEDNVGALSRGAGSTENTILRLCALAETFPWDTTPGTYFVGVYADHLNTVAESDENDNGLATRPSIYVDCIGPNLVIAGSATSASYSSSTKNLTIRTRVINNGTASAGSSTLGYYLSEGSSIATSDYRIGTDHVGSLTPGETSDEDITVNLCTVTAVPQFSTPGTYYVGVYADYRKEVTEINEADNNLAIPPTIFVECPTTAGPNLTIDPSSTAGFDNATCTLSLNAKVCNTGDANAAASMLGYYLSTDASITTSDCRLGDDAVGALSPLQCSNQTLTVNLRTVSCATIPGTYYVGLIADYLNQVTESNENDNATRFEPAINATCPACPGQVVARIACPSQVGEGSRFQVPITVDLSGSPAPNDRLGSFTGSLAWDPSLLRYVSHSGLQAGFTGAVNTSNVNLGRLNFNGANPPGVPGNVTVLTITFEVVGTDSSTGIFDLAFSAMSAALSFADLLPCLITHDCSYHIRAGGLCGDINDDGLINSSDALIILSYDIGIPIPPEFLAKIIAGFGDMNVDGLTNSTDALIILTCDAGLPQCPPRVGQPGSCR